MTIATALRCVRWKVRGMSDGCEQDHGRATLLRSRDQIRVVRFTEKSRLGRSLAHDAVADQLQRSCLIQPGVAAQWLRWVTVENGNNSEGVVSGRMECKSFRLDEDVWRR